MRTFLMALLAASALTLASPAQAQGNIGLGLVGEDPSGLTLKLKLSEQQALDFRLGLGFRFDNAILVQGNYLLTLFDITSNGNFSLPFYIGGGATLFIFNGNNNNDGIGLTGRVPIGVAMEVNAVPIDIFLEVAPQIAILPGIAVGIDGALGVRYWF